LPLRNPRDTVSQRILNIRELAIHDVNVRRSDCPTCSEHRRHPLSVQSFARCSLAIGQHSSRRCGGQGRVDKRTYDRNDLVQNLRYFISKSRDHDLILGTPYIFKSLLYGHANARVDRSRDALDATATRQPSNVAARDALNCVFEDFAFGPILSIEPVSAA
jgi:hypothetical protein